MASQETNWQMKSAYPRTPYLIYKLKQIQTLSFGEEIANKRFILQAHLHIGPALPWLIQDGIGVEDIMGIHNLVQAL